MTGLFHEFTPLRKWRLENRKKFLNSWVFNWFELHSSLFFKNPKISSFTKYKSEHSKKKFYSIFIQNKSTKKIIHTYLKRKFAHYKDILFTMKSIVFTNVNTELCQARRKKMFFYSNFWPPNQANNNRRFARCSRFLVFWSRLSLITMRIRKIYLTMFYFLNFVSLNM